MPLASLKNPDHRLPLELLSLLPRHPLMVPIMLVADDLGLSQASDVMRLVRDIDTRGISIGKRGNTTNREICIAPGSWHRAQAIANEYVDRLEPV